MSPTSTLVLATALLTFASVASAAPPKHVMSAAETHTLRRADGTTITYYLQLPERSAPHTVPLLLINQGSQEDSASTMALGGAKLPERFGTAVLIVEKPGVTARSKPCNAEYMRLNSMDQRLADVVAVIRSFEGSTWWSGRLLVLGGSEGGPLSVKVAGVLPVERAALIVTGAGFTMAEAMPSILMAGVAVERPAGMAPAPPSALANALTDLPRAWLDIEAHPDAQTVFFGPCYTYKYWHSWLWFRPVDTMLQTATRYLLVHGERDPMHPVESARATVRRYREAGNDRLEYWELPGLDHGLARDGGPSQVQEYADKAIAWLFEK